MQGQDHLVAKISSLTQCLGDHEQIIFLHSFLRILSKQTLFLAAENGNRSEKQEQSRAVSAGAAVISGIIKDSVTLTDGVMDWVIGATGDGFAHNTLMHRAGIAALSSDHGMKMLEGRRPMLNVSKLE
jgi:hypothetical protein